VDATTGKRLSLKKGIKQHLVADRHNLNKLVDHETRKEYQIDVANRFWALEGLEISSVDDTWVKIRDNIKESTEEKVGILERDRNKSWFDQECSELANKRKRPKLFLLKMTKLQKSLLILGTTPVEPSRKRNIIAWKQ
jgi:hypothetical protein